MRTVVYLSNSDSTETHRMNPFKKASGSSGGSFLNFVCGLCFLSVFGNLQHHFPQRIHTWRIRRGNGERGVCLSLSSSSGASDTETRFALGFRYHHTGPVSGFFALRESLAILAERGLEESWRKHKEVAAYLYKGLEDLGLKLFIPDKELRLPSVTTISIPEGYEWREMLTYIMKNHQMEMTGGLGPSVGMVIRIGLMGYNCEKTNADKALHALADALKNCKKSKA
ncbi:serine--pyruvate aminotransferase, mitochondrial-like [Poecilia reticulata]|uniref:serine--pyruvate aminotransferase, mitochondrial-like n=1 Tax=Poecilia reticulata TaxID=8081 RepID=UPI0004A339F6|nr:PREDICTED: serine--pyruvate aminotransferase, mitochondrial-like [Poecilia reticulata]